MERSVPKNRHFCSEFKRVSLLLATLFLTIPLLHGQSPYCDPDYSTGCSFGDRIDEMSLSNLSRTNTGCTGAYEHFTADTIVLEKQIAYTITLASGNTYNQGFGAWMDYDGNDGFGGSGEFLGTSIAGNAGMPTQINFTVPNSADTSGTTRLRLRSTYNSEPFSSDSCSTLNYGEAEDYVVDIRPAPSCLPPKNLILDSASTDSALIAWNSLNGGVNEWDLTYGPTGFGLGNGTDTIHSTDSSTWIGGLSPGTSYDVFVREICGPNDSSYWAGPFTFTTDCGIFQAPYLERIDQNNTPNCWTEVTSNGSGWEYGQQGDPGYGASSIPEHTGNGGYFAWVDFSGGNDEAQLVSPEIDVSALSTPELRFFLFSHNSSSEGNNSIIVEAHDGNTWIEVDSFKVNSPKWVERRNLLDSSAFGDTIRFRIRVKEDPTITGYHNDLLFDDLQLREAPPNDLSGLEVLDPDQSACKLQDAKIRARIKNVGGMPQDSFRLGYTVNGVAPEIDTVFQSLAPGEELIHEFAPNNLMAADGTYQLTVFSDLNSDTLSYNDSSSVTVENGSGSLLPTHSQHVGIMDDETWENGQFICGARYEEYGCPRILSLTIDSLHHEDALDELRIELVSPEGSSLILWDQLGGPSEQVMDQLVFSDTVSDNITSASGTPYSGTYQPQESTGFAKFNGERIHGKWTLRIVNDDFSDTAAFFGWNMQILNPKKPQIELGPDTSLCQEDNYLLDPGNGDDWSYVWDDNSTDSTRQVVGTFLDSNTTYTYAVTVTDEDPLNQCRRTDSIEVTIQNCTGLEQARRSGASFEVYPIPATEQLFIESQGLKGQGFRYELCDLQGRTIEQRKSERSRAVLELSGHSKGVYLLKGYRMGSDAQLFQRKVVIQ